MAKIKRIFLTGGPGSMWCGADRLIRSGFGANADNSDITDDKEWRGHLGAYWHPGSPPGNDWVNNFAEYSRTEIETMLDSVFEEPHPDSEFVVRVHKSHYWVYHLDKIEELFPECDIVAKIQEPWKCIAWWQYYTGHDHVHDPYDYYHRDIEEVWNGIVEQTQLLDEWIKKNNLVLDHADVNFFRKHFGEPSKLLIREMQEVLRNPDGVNHWAGRGCMSKNLSNTSYAVIKYGTPRQF